MRVSQLSRRTPFWLKSGKQDSLQYSFLLFLFKWIKTAYQNQSLILEVPGVHQSPTSRNSLGYSIFWVGHRVPMSFWLKSMCSLRKSLLVRKLVPNGSQAWWWQGCAWFSFIWSVGIHRILSCSSHSYKQGNPAQCSMWTNKAHDRGSLRNTDGEHPPPGLSQTGKAWGESWRT